MSVQPYRANLAAMAFPFLSELSGRAVIVKQVDQNYVATVTSKDDLDKDVGVATLYYCHNIIATSQGYQSIDYVTNVAAVVGIADFVEVFPVIDSIAGKKAYLGMTAAGTLYYSYDPYYSWTFLTALPAAAGKTITTAYINGITYIYFANVGCYKFNFGTNALDSVTLTSLVSAVVLGIVAVQGYLVAWSNAALAWSSLIDPTDFTPSLVTGAGGGAVQGARGDIVSCIAHTIGFVVYTNQNAVAAPASGNSRYPFNFRELVASGGLASSHLVTYDANSGNHYAYTTSGLQLISLQQTQTVIPELTDFLAGAVFEDFDETTETLSTTELSAPMKKRLILVSDRYLVISYGISSYTHALIYDLALKRWSKIKHNHVQVFEFSLLQAETVETPRRSIALLSNTGEVKVVKIDSMNPNSNGVLLLGKYQLVRTRLTTLEEITVENIPLNANFFKLAVWYALKGKVPTKVDATLLETDGLARRYAVHKTATNHSLLMRGAFNLCSLLGIFHNHGRR